MYSIVAAVARDDVASTAFGRVSKAADGELIGDSTSHRRPGKDGKEGRYS